MGFLGRHRRADEAQGPVTGVLFDKSARRGRWRGLTRAPVTFYI